MHQFCSLEHACCISLHSFIMFSNVVQKAVLHNLSESGLHYIAAQSYGCLLDFLHF